MFHIDARGLQRVRTELQRIRTRVPYPHSDDSPCKVIAFGPPEKPNNGATPKYVVAMTLAPKTQPGRRTRKARQCHAKIRQLHAAGYSLTRAKAALKATVG